MTSSLEEATQLPKWDVDYILHLTLCTWRWQQFNFQELVNSSNKSFHSVELHKGFRDAFKSWLYYSLATQFALLFLRQKTH